MARQGKIYLNGVCYSGSDVEGNPSEIATDTLSSIRIENDIFSIPSGGGGGGSLTELYSYDATSDPTQASFDLNNGTNINDYDVLIFLFRKDGGSSYVTDSVIIPTSMITNLPSGYVAEVNTFRDGSYRYYSTSNGLSWTLSLESDNRWRCTKVYGI